MSQQIRGQGGHIVFLISFKNRNLVEEFEILHPSRFHLILCRGFRGEVKNVSADPRPGRPSCFYNQPETNTNFVEDIEILLPLKFR